MLNFMPIVYNSFYLLVICRNRKLCRMLKRAFPFDKSINIYLIKSLGMQKGVSGQTGRLKSSILQFTKYLAGLYTYDMGVHSSNARCFK